MLAKMSSEDEQTSAMTHPIGSGEQAIDSLRVRQTLCTTQVLFWLEAMSLMDNLSDARTALLKISLHPEVCILSSRPNLC